MTHPFMKIPRNRLAIYFWPLLAVTLVLMAIMNYAGTPLVNSTAPSGIVSFELAGSTEKAGQIIASWDAKTQMAATFGLGLDYLFMVVYSTAIGLGCIWAGRVLQERSWPLCRLGLWLGWGLWAAAVFDGTENLALLRLLFVGVASPWPEIAQVCAILKFSLIISGILYCLLGFISSRVSGTTSQTARP